MQGAYNIVYYFSSERLVHSLTEPRRGRTPSVSYSIRNNGTLEDEEQRERDVETRENQIEKERQEKEERWRRVWEQQERRCVHCVIQW